MNDMYCWNCKKNVEVIEKYIEYIGLELAEEIGKPVDVLFCSECNAILSPKRKRCDVCGKNRRVYIIGVMTHGGGTYIPICRECIIKEYLHERRQGMGLET
ncbi:MAG: hypothetical protein OEZ52_11910 [Candidatus Aminicenantes bacterium]|nr:hypothetical protein [Candidatus Aminicenantes bacterium]